MGTDARVVVCTPEARDAALAVRPAIQAVRMVERRMSTYRPDSEVSLLNSMAHERPVWVSEPTRDVLRRSVEIWRLTGGAFDVTYAPLRDLWRRAVEEGKEPEPDALAATLSLVGSDRLIIKDSHIGFAAEGMAVDLGGIAKGHAIELAADTLQEAGVQAALVDIGGDIRLLGAPAPDRPWRVRVRRPPGGPDQVILRLSSCAVATSGDYARGFRVGEEWYSHVIDPRSGHPVESVPSVTVLAPDAATADALATALGVMGPDAALSLVGSLPEIECMMMLRMQDGSARVVSSPGFQRFVVD
jgi:thiamine biosynthesis lipoprotein